jgi:endoglucanase
VEAYADSVTEDVMGNLIVFKKGKTASSKKLMLCAHMDEVGVIITDITDEGYLKFSFVGGVDRRVTVSKPVYIGRDRVFGVITAGKPLHLVPQSDRKKAPSGDDLYIDIGADSKEEAEKLAALGDTGAFSPENFEFGNNLLKAKAIDDRAGCAALIKTIQGETPVDCTFVFTVQEEVGTRGAAVAAFKLEPDIALIAEGTTAADLPSVSGNKKICSPGKGVVIPFMDGGSIYSRDMYKLLTELADKNGIKWQTKTYISGGTDGSAVQRSRAGVMVGGIAVAVRNIHSPSSVASMDDLDGLKKLIDAFLNEMSAKYGN